MLPPSHYQEYFHDPAIIPYQLPQPIQGEEFPGVPFPLFALPRFPSH